MGRLTAPRTKNTMPPSAKIFLGIFLGVATGIFLGELALPLEIAGEIFIRLLQMVVLPYIVVSLVSGLGRLRHEDGKRLFLTGGGVLLLLWVVGLAAVAVMPLAFPNWESASFFSATIAQEKAAAPAWQMYVPSNPFQALARGEVPGVVVFSLLLGAALLPIPGKARFLEDVLVVEKALLRLTGWIMHLAPFGVFAIAAVTAGTLGLEDFQRLQVYVVAQATLSLILVFVILPLVAMALTPLTYGEVFACTRTVLATSFATGNLLVVLPSLGKRLRELFHRNGIFEENILAQSDVLVSSSFNFPNLGKILSLGFVIFAGWFMGMPVSLAQEGQVLFTGIFVLFADTVVALPFLFDRLRLPSDFFSLYMSADVFVGRFTVMAAAMHTAVLSLVGVHVLARQARLNWHRLFFLVALGGGLTMAVLLGVRAFFTTVVDYRYDKGKSFVDMPSFTEPVAARLISSSGRLSSQPGPALARIEKRKTLRVGFPRDALPYVFVNEQGEVRGFDADMMQTLAREMGVALEWVRLDEQEKTAQLLKGGVIDLVVGGVAVTTDRARELSFSSAVLDETLALVTADHRRHEFSSLPALEKKRFRLAVLEHVFLASQAKSFFPNAEIGMIESPRAFFRQKDDRFDALLFAAESGAAWTLIYPRYAVVVPEGLKMATPVAYATSQDDAAFGQFLDAWLTLKRKEGLVKNLFDYWFTGKTSQESKPRWSVIRDVLHWVP